VGLEIWSAKDDGTRPLSTQQVNPNPRTANPER
jgi:hypothetical protein